MTNEIYIRLYRKAHILSGRITRQTQKVLQEVFIEAGRLASNQMLRANFLELSDLTSTSWQQISKQLQAGADLISQTTEKTIPVAMSRAYQNYLDVDTEYIFDAAQQAGVGLITETGIENMGTAVNFRLLQVQAERIYSDGYTFSERVWNTLDSKGFPTGINGDYQYRIKNLILTGEAQGRDVVKIADDIQQYIKKGKKFVFKQGRYGNLIPGTAEFKKRISQKVDWRALRLVRSELNASLQQAGVLDGIMNPASDKTYDWKKTPGNPIDEDGSKNASGLKCIELEDANPYTLENVPSYQHSNCSCSVVPNLRKREDFVNDLRNWSPGGEPAYINDWFNDIYRPAKINRR